MKKDIEKMTDWEILEYLRQDRQWMVLSSYTRNDYLTNFDISFETDEQWIEFTEEMCDKWSEIQYDTVEVILESF